MKSDACCVDQLDVNTLGVIDVDQNISFSYKNVVFQLLLDSNGFSLSKSVMYSQVRQIIDQLYASLPDRALPVMLINISVISEQQAFQNYLSKMAPELKTTTAFYSAENNQIVVFWNGDQQQVYGFIRHEVTHFMINSLYPFLPLWLNEGLAEYFESIDANGLPQANDYWLMTLREKKVMSLSLFLRLPTQHWRAKDQKRMYAMAWSLVFYMMSTPSTRALLVAVLQRSAVLNTDSELTHTFIDRHYAGGVTALNSDWLAWLSSNDYALVK